MSSKVSEKSDSNQRQFVPDVEYKSLYVESQKKVTVFVFVASEYETPEYSLNQISLWDGIIPSKNDAKFWGSYFEHGSNFRGKEFNFTLHWHVIPKLGTMFADKIVMSGHHLPEEYR